MALDLIIVPTIAVGAVMGLLAIGDNQAIYIHEVSVPAEMTDRGQTSTIMTDLLADEMRRIVAVADTSHQSAPVDIGRDSFASAIAEYLHITEPVKELRMLVGAIGFEVEGEFTLVGGDTVFDLRVEQHQIHQRARLKYQGVESDPATALRAAAHDVLEAIDPYTVALYDLRQAVTPEDYALVMAKIEDCFAAYPPTFHHRIENLIGEALLLQDKPTEAGWHFKRALSYDAGFDEAKLNLAIVLDETGHRDEARQMFEDLATADEEGWPWDESDDALRAAALTMLGTMLDREGEHEGALRLMHAAVEIAPESSGPHQVLASRFAAQGYGAFASYHRAVATRLMAQADSGHSESILDLRSSKASNTSALEPEAGPDVLSSTVPTASMP